MSDKVTEFKPVDETVKQRLTRWIADSITTMEEQTEKPVTAVVAVLVTDDGELRVCWQTNDHAWPAAAVVGAATRAIFLEGK